MSNIFKCDIFGFRDSFYTGWIGNYQYIQWQLIFILSFWALSGGNSQAAQVHQNRSSLLALVSNSTSIDSVLFHHQESQEIKLLEQLNQAPILIAAPENFNPGLRVPPPLPKTPVIKPPETPSPPPALKPGKPTKPVVLEGIQTNFRNDTDNFGQHNLFIEPTFQWRSPNGNKIFLKTGFDFFEQRGVASVSNIPLQIGWQGKIGDITLQTAAGVDFFDRLPTAINFNTKVEIPIVPPKVSSTGKLLSGLILSANLDHSPYKFNALTLDNQITAWRFGPDLYWQINRDTSLFSSLRLGNYNDGNSEIQSFSRLERKLGQFSLAANLFTWSYDRNVETTHGYFSPPDFLVYNAELAWEGDIADFLRCRLSATLGQQRLNGEFDHAYGYQTRCTAKLSPKLEADLDYSFSNVRNQDTGGSGYGGNSLTGQFRVKF
ncbi:hypothetical protein [Nostoc cycadae]|uniref:Uncharacterized protein n=1 Tax=Nostoc cycadae WK-1 TaxID=1861711 RepID=A0A2H6LEQ4_9NOSO|nr:hypothetical protein [Nostoc cycadae]GBE91705.1 hypothetical protein NCWK1_1432 [Nostoc cycadae WK-1]